MNSSRGSYGDALAPGGDDFVSGAERRAREHERPKDEVMLSIRMPKAKRDRLKLEAVRAGRPVVELVNEAIDQLLRDLEQRPEHDAFSDDTL